MERSRITLVPLLLLLLCAGLCQAVSPCQDIDPAACQAMASQDPKMCEDESLSSVACPRFCKLCPMECYNCLVPSNSDVTCNVTKQCRVGERCMTRRLLSTADGHGEVDMRCASVQICDLTAFSNIIGKRDVSIHCCDSDLCNSYTTTTTPRPTTTTPRPTTTTPRPTTTTPRPTTTTPRPTTTASTTQHVTTPSTAPPTTLPPGCNNDITLLIQDWQGRSAADTITLMTFIKDFLGKLDIGSQSNKVGVTLFDNDVHVQWKLNSYQASYKAYLMRYLGLIHFHHDDDDVDYDDIKDYLKKLSNHTYSHDRLGTKDVLIIFADDDIDAGEMRTLGRHITFDKIIYVSIRQNAYVGSFHVIAQDTFQVSTFQTLWTIENRLLTALCDFHQGSHSVPVSHHGSHSSAFALG